MPYIWKASCILLEQFTKLSNMGEISIFLRILYTYIHETLYLLRKANFCISIYLCFLNKCLQDSQDEGWIYVLGRIVSSSIDYELLEVWYIYYYFCIDIRKRFDILHICFLNSQTSDLVWFWFSTVLLMSFLRHLNVLCTHPAKYYSPLKTDESLVMQSCCVSISNHS